MLLCAVFPAPYSIAPCDARRPSPHMNLSWSKTGAHQQQPTFLGPLPMPVSTPAFASHAWLITTIFPFNPSKSR